jgi:hypothetical protein
MAASSIEGHAEEAAVPKELFGPLAVVVCRVRAVVGY